MKIDTKASLNWLNTTFRAFPMLQESIAFIPSEVLIIGAAVLQFYKAQDWITFARRTGDIDLSIEITPDSETYTTVKEVLKQHGYSEDPEMKYRLQKSIKGLQMGFITIDLLVHPSDSADETEARSLMGVGEEWNFDGIRIGLQEKITISENVNVPNPLGFIGLKLHSYHGDPRRVRDIVDIIDIISGFVAKARHYDLADVWLQMAKSQHPSIPFMTGALRELADPDSVTWDLGLARQEFIKRGYRDEDVDEGINHTIQEFNDALGI